MGSGWRSRVTFLVARPAIGRLWPGRRIECRSAQGFNLNLSAVHEKIRSRAYGQRFRNWFRVKASGSIGPMCFKSGAVPCAPPIVRDESSRVFLGGALQQSPPLRRPSSMVGQFSLEVNRKEEPAVRRRALLPSSKPAKLRLFYSGADSVPSRRYFRHLGRASSRIAKKEPRSYTRPFAASIDKFPTD